MKSNIRFIRKNLHEPDSRQTDKPQKGDLKDLAFPTN